MSRRFPLGHASGRSVVVVLMGLMILASTAIGAEIHDLARQGDLAAVTALVQADPQMVNQPTERLGTPLHFAATGGRDDVAAFLLDNGADLQAKDVDGDAPLSWAAARGHDATCGLLLDRGATINDTSLTGDTALLNAVRANHHATAQLLIERGADLELPNDYGRTPLLWCARETGDHDMAVLLLDAGANIDAADRFGATSIELVSWRGFRQLVNLFLDRGCAVVASGNQGGMMLANATEKGLDRLYARLVADGVDIDLTVDDSGGILHRSAGGGSAAIVTDLLDRGVAINAVDGFGWTALHHAASRGRIDAVKLLLERSADPEMRTRSGWSARNLAVDQGHFLVEQALTMAHPPRKFPRLEGKYLGQQIPESGGAVFAPDIANGPSGSHSSVAISPAGDHMLWHQYESIPDSGYWTGTILESNRVEGKWSEPRRAWFALIGDDVPFFHPDGSRLFFMSRRPLEPGGGNAERIWVMDRTEEGWSIPSPLPACINNMRQHWLFSVAENGDLYFNSRRGAEQGVYVSRFGDGQYGEPQFLGFGGDTPFIAPDQSYLITLDFIDNQRVNNIRFRNDDQTWSEPMDIRSAAGDRVGGLCPVVSPDGKAFFYLASPWGANNICWSGAGFIKELRKDR
jgi:ankyrin repeat protein